MFVAVFSNNTAKGPDVVSTKMAAIAIGKPYTHTEIPVSSDVIGKYTGVYEDSEGNQGIVSVDSNKLYARVGEGSSVIIRQFERDKFYLDESFMVLIFNRNASGAITDIVSDDRGY